MKAQGGLQFLKKLLKNKKRSHQRFLVRLGRMSIWWKNFVKEVVIPEEWRDNFRMSRDNFFKLSRQLRPQLEKQITNMRLPMSVEKQVAIFLYYIADEGRYRKVANSFGISRAAVSKIIKKVSMVISLHLGPKHIKCPQTEEEVTTAASMFYEKHGFPQCIGAIDCTHIFIKRPYTTSTDYLNRKNRYYLNVQAVCNYKYCFLDVVVKWPGSGHDARIFSNSSVTICLRDETIPKCTRVIVENEEPVPICILGDPAYYLLPFLMKEFPGGGSTVQEQIFGYRLSSARMVIECSFGRLKARFGC